MELVKKFSDKELPNVNDAGSRVLARIEPMKTRLQGNTGMEDLVWGIPVSLKKTAK